MTGYGLGLEYEYINQYKKLFRTVDFFFHIFDVSCCWYKKH